jgi:hypothetical protein
MSAALQGNAKVGHAQRLITHTDLWFIYIHHIFANQSPTGGDLQQRVD